MTDSTTIVCGLISTDSNFRALATEAINQAQPHLCMGMEIGVPFTQIGDEQLRELREVNPGLIVLDLELDPVLGLKFAQFLSDQAPGRAVVAAGPMLPAELLLTAIRAGITEYLPKPVTQEGIRGALEGVLRRRQVPGQPQSTEPGELISIFSPKGGAGSTTLAANLAIHMHRLTGKRTLLVDLDLELGEIALLLGIEPRFSFIDMVRNFHRMDSDLLASYIEHHDSGVHLLSAPYHPERAEMVTGEQIAKILNFLTRHYDYVIVDTSKSFSAATLATFERANSILLVTVADLPSLRNITRCLPLLRQVVGEEEERVRLVVNRHRRDEPIALGDVERTLGMPIFATIANDYSAVVHAINTGSPIIMNGTSRYSRDLRLLGAKMAGLGAETERSSVARLSRMVQPLTQIWRRTVSSAPEVQP